MGPLYLATLCLPRLDPPHLEPPLTCSIVIPIKSAYRIPAHSRFLRATKISTLLGRQIQSLENHISCKMAKDPEKMDVDPPGDVSNVSIVKAKLQKSHDLFTSTIRKPPHAYAQLEVLTHPPDPAAVDEIQVRMYFTKALEQFLGVTGTAIPIDILKVQDKECWVRIPREDLGPFTSAITAWTGESRGGVTSILRLRACGDWLGSVLGRTDQQRLWDS